MPKPHNHCDCHFDCDTGYFEACCEEHQQEYIDYLEQQALRRELKEANNA